jgi:hypothetical protein
VNSPRQTSNALTSDPERLAVLEPLAKMAARAAGRDPDERVRVVLGDTVAFDDVTWRYDDFIQRAEAAYKVLTGPTCS